MNISVILPVFNEEALIAQSIDQVRQAARLAPPEIIVVDGGSQDRTREAATAAADQVLQAMPGRASQMHVGALAARGDILLFLHVDTRLPDGWDVALARAWASSPRPSVTAFRLSYDHPRTFYRALATLAHWRSRLSGVVHGDQGIAVSRETYFAVGGYPPVPLMEEYYLLPKLRRKGRLVILPERISTSARRYEKNGPLFNAVRNSVLIGLHYCGVSPERLARYYSVSTTLRPPSNA